MENTNKPLIELCEFDGIGLIIECSSGVRYTNQTGGYACLHPEIEGVFIPIADSSFSELEKLEAFFIESKWKGSCYRGIDEETAVFVDEVLSNTFTGHAIEVNREKFHESHEAWIQVTVSQRGEKSELWSGFEDSFGVVTWQNSD